MPPGLREATDGDGPALVALVGAVFDEYPGCVLDLADLDADLPAPRSSFAARGARLWVLDDETGGLAACVGIGAPGAGGVPGRVVELKRLYVAASARGRGLGTALVAHVHAVARTLGADGAELWSDTRFAAGHRRYVAAGYEQRAVTRELHDPSATTEQAFFRLLGPPPPPVATATWAGPEGTRDRCLVHAGPVTNRLTGTVVGDVRWDYDVVADERWRTRLVELRRDGVPHLQLAADGRGSWWQDGLPRDDLAGCLDVDLTTTCATNTLPVQRLLAGQALDGPVAWWDADTDRVVPHDQHYAQGPDGTWRFTSPGFGATLTVDDHGLVTSYADLFTRLA